MSKMFSTEYIAEGPNYYGVTYGGNRIGGVQKYGRNEWVAYPAYGMRMSREFRTRHEAGVWVLREWDRTQQEAAQEYGRLASRV